MEPPCLPFIENDTRQHSSQKVVDRRCSRPQTTLNHVSIFFSPQFQTPLGKIHVLFQSASRQRLCATHWREQRCLDSYRQQQMSQSDWEISTSCGKIYLFPCMYNWWVMFYSSRHDKQEGSHWRCLAKTWATWSASWDRWELCDHQSDGTTTWVDSLGGGGEGGRWTWQRTTITDRLVTINVSCDERMCLLSTFKYFYM